MDEIIVEIDEEDEEIIMDVTILGLSIGTASGWDEWSDFGLVFYDFEPNDHGKLFLGALRVVTGTLAIDFNTGVVEACDDDGNTQSYSVDWSVFNAR